MYHQKEKKKQKRKKESEVISQQKKHPVFFDSLKTRLFEQLKMEYWKSFGDSSVYQRTGHWNLKSFSSAGDVSMWVK